MVSEKAVNFLMRIPSRIAGFLVIFCKFPKKSSGAPSARLVLSLKCYLSDEKLFLKRSLLLVWCFLFKVYFWFGVF